MDIFINTFDSEETRQRWLSRLDSDEKSMEYDEVITTWDLPGRQIISLQKGTKHIIPISEFIDVVFWFNEGQADVLKHTKTLTSPENQDSVV